MMASYNRIHICAAFAIVLILSLSSISLASPTQKLTTKAQPLVSRELLEDGTLNCETERSSDYYGIGVRLGLYFAWLQAWIANVSVPSEISLAMDTNTIFLFAILVSMVRCTITGLLLQLDGLLLMHAGGGTIFSVLSVWGYRTCVYDIHGPAEGIKQFGGWGTHFRLLLSMGISTFGLFYWVWGIKGSLNPDLDPGCETVYTFMFSKIRADGGIRIFYIIICIGCMIYFGSMLLVSLVAFPMRLRRLTHAHNKGDAVSRIRLKFATGLNQKQLRQIFYFLRIGNFFFIVYSILLIEFSLNYNHVAGVLGWRGHIFFPSQVIPMIIGAFGFCRVIWVRYLQWKSPDYMHPSTRRSLFRIKKSELMKMYTPKSNANLEFHRDRRDDEIDPLLKGQSLALRLLVSWAPWLAAVQWWKNGPEDTHYGALAEQDPESPGMFSNSIGGGWSSDSTPRMGGPAHRDTWASDETIAGRLGTELPQIPKTGHFGTI